MSKIASGFSPSPLISNNQISKPTPLVVKADNTRVQSNPQAFLKTATNIKNNATQANNQLKSETKNGHVNTKNAGHAHSWHSTTSHTTHKIHTAIEATEVGVKVVKSGGSIVKAATELAHHAEHLGSATKIVKNGASAFKVAQGTEAALVIAKGAGGLGSKILPGVGAAVCAYAAFENAGKLEDAMYRRDYGQAGLAAVQVGLNVVGGVAGFIPGAGTVVSAACGVLSFGISFLQDE